MTFFYDDDDDDKQVQPRTMKRSQTLRFVNGYAILTDDATSSRASMVEEDFLEEEEDVEGDISKARGEKEGDVRPGVRGFRPNRASILRKIHGTRAR